MNTIVNRDFASKVPATNVYRLGSRSFKLPRRIAPKATWFPLQTNHGTPQANHFETISLNRAAG